VINQFNSAQHQSQPNLPQSSVPNLSQQQVLQPIPSSASTVNANILPAQPGVPPVSSTFGAVGGINLVPSQPLINDQPDVDLPRITMNLPPLYHTGYGSQGRRFKDPRNVLFHDNNDLQWDNAYQIQLSTDVDFNIPAGSVRSNSNNPFVQNPPLASSDPKYPSLPVNFYGSVPAISYSSTPTIAHTSPQAISHHPHAFPTHLSCHHLLL
jgi:hypothetical protein